MLALKPEYRPSLFKPDSKKTYLRVNKTIKGNFVSYFFDTVDRKKQKSENTVLIAALPASVKWIPSKTSVTYEITGEMLATAIWADRNFHSHISHLEGRSALLEAIALADLKRNGIVWFGDKGMVAVGMDFSDLTAAGLEEKVSAPISFAAESFLAAAAKAAHEFYEREKLLKQMTEPWDGISELNRPPPRIKDRHKIKIHSSGETELHDLK